MSDYKTAKESWISDLTGSTVIHVNFVSFTGLSTVILYSFLVSRALPSQPIYFPIQWMILVFPLLLSMTLYANMPAILSITLSILAYIISFYPHRYAGTPLPSQNPMPSSPPQSKATGPQMSPLPAVTVYRAHMMLMTILCILAVDFPVFPRTLAKCETFGVSLMDLGVGSFVFSQGLVSAIPILKNPAHLSAPAIPKIRTVIRKSLPITLLGLVRVLLVKGTSYPEHESEYGTHWNFFITLSLLPILQVFLHPIVKRFPIALLGILVASAHQSILSFLGMHDFVLYGPRVGIISANKEGLVSLAGYLAIHLLGLSAGTVILPPSPKYLNRALKRQSRPRNNSSSQDIRNRLAAPRENDHTAMVLFSYTFIWWTCFYVMKYFGVGGVGVSRRMVNMQYIFWVVAFNTSFILGYLLIHMTFQFIYLQQSLKVPENKNGGYQLSQQRPFDAPPLLEAINKNGLVLFLAANVATGLVNLAIPTMYTSDLYAMIILSVYSFALSWLAWIFRDKRLVRL